MVKYSLVIKLKLKLFTDAEKHTGNNYKCTATPKCRTIYDNYCLKIYSFGWKKTTRYVVNDALIDLLALPNNTNIGQELKSQLCPCSDSTLSFTDSSALFRSYQYTTKYCTHTQFPILVEERILEMSLFEK